MRRFWIALAGGALAASWWGAAAIAQSPPTRQPTRGPSPSPAASPSPSPGRAARPAPGGALLIALPEEEARILLSTEAAVGLGVFGAGRDAAAFLAEVGVPDGLPGLEGTPLRRRIEAAGVGVGVAVHSGARGTQSERLARAFLTGGPQRFRDALRAPLTVLALDLADDVRSVRAREPGATTIVVGAGARTPVLVGRLDSDGLLGGGIARRTAVVTPMDVAATLLDALGLDHRPSGGNPLRSTPASLPLERLDEMRARMERDADFAPGLVKATVGVVIGGIVFAAASALLRRYVLAGAFVRGSALAPAGYVGALFVPDPRWEVRALVVLGAVLLGMAIPAPPRRAAAWILFATAAAVALLAVAAAARPDGEPALSLWGDPLVSFRFFGLRNHLAAFVAGGVIVGLGLLSVRPWVFGGVAVGAGVIVGAPSIGANFVGVLTLGLGATIALLGSIAGRVRALHLAVAALTGAGATMLALIVDTGSPVSHGGRAVEQVRIGGAQAMWDILRRRARLNYAEIVDIGVVAWVGLVVLAAGLAWLLVWSVRSGAAPARARAAIGGTAAAAIAALVLEDSGFLTAGTIAAYPAIGFLADRLATVKSAAATAPPPT